MEKENATPIVKDVGLDTASAKADATETPDSAQNDDMSLPDIVVQPGDPILVKTFGEQILSSGEETTPCVTWKLNNAKPIYINAVSLANEGGYHHSNWFVVPDTAYSGPDGYFPCSERGFDELEAAVQGTVLFAQSTQSREEVQKLPDGVVIKIPPFHRVVAGLHLLNISTRELETNLRMRMDLLHPKDVEVVVSPFRLTYRDLQISANGESRFTSQCEIAEAYRTFTGGPFDLKLYWILPHYHALGNYFELSIVGGPRDGENLFTLEGFNAEANGQAFDPPIDMTGADGFRFTCGFNNPRDEPVGWGIGDQEMCVMLGFADSSALVDAGVVSDNALIGNENGIDRFEGPCSDLILPKNRAQAMPSDEEIAAPLYVPISDEDPDDFVLVPECVDTPDDAEAKFAPTLSTIQQDIFTVSCGFSACHGAENPAFGLDLVSPGLHERLLLMTPQGDTELPFITDSDASSSWLYTAISECDPGGNIAAMPRNTPTLLDPGLVAMVRDWINNGALDN